MAAAVLALLGAAPAWASSSAARPAASECCSGDARPEDEVWLIRSRSCGCDPSVEPRLSVYRYERSGDGPARRWRSRGLASFLGGQGARLPTVIYVHGNRVGSSAAWSRALRVYRALVRSAGDAPPIRFVMWAWPAERIRGPLKDVRVKARRTGPAGYRLAWLVDRLEPETPVGMVGFSFGARVITGALHLLGGGRMGRYRLAERHHPDRPPVRAVLLTAALDSDWLLPGHYHGRALDQVDRMLVMINPSDRAMRWYRLIDRCRRPEALGRCGIASLAALGPRRSKIEQRNVACQLGPVHDVAGYLGNGPLMRQTLRFASFSVASSSRADLAGRRLARNGGER